MEKICLASDNWTAAHPAIIEALAAANNGYTPAYGGDPWTAKAEALIQEEFGASAKVIFVPTGTGANVIGFKLACRPFESVICSDIAHAQVQECGAAESIVGCKLLTVPHLNGKVTVDAIIKKLRTERAFGKHCTFPKVVSVTQPTEVGTCYSLDELKSLSELCKTEGLYLHIDGSRLYNAAASMKTSLGNIGKFADLLSLGGTKNGLLFAEALVILNPSLHDGADHLHKQNLSLLSKMRYLSAQYVPFLEQGLWKTFASHANQKAQELATLLRHVPEIKLSYPIETNQIFFTAPAHLIAEIQENIACHLWDKEKGELRWITSWNTTDENILAVKKILGIK